MNVRSFELFSTRIDGEESIEKVVLNENEMKEFFNLLEGQTNVEVAGFYGSLGEVQDSLKLNYQINLLKNCSNQKGKILGINYQMKALLCLIFPDNFFLQKPLDEKSINLTLFRIFSDVVQHIQVCFGKEIFENWYEGEQLPFRILQTSTQLAFADCQQPNQLLEEESVKIKQEFHEIFLNHSTQVCNYAISNIFRKNADEMKLEFESSFEEFANQFIKFKNANFDQLNNTYEFIPPSIIDDLNLHPVLRNYNIQKQKKSLLNILATLNTNKNSNLEIKLQERIKFAIRNETQKLMSKQQFKTQLQFQFKEYQTEIKKNVKGNSEINFIFQKPNIQVLTSYQDFEQLSSSILQDSKKSQLSMISMFKVSNYTHLFIFYDQYELSSIVYLLPKESHNWIRLLEIKNHYNPLFYYLNLNNSLYAFNTQSKNQISRYRIKSCKIEKFEEILISQHFQKAIIFIGVVYLKKNNKFILFSDNKRLYNTHKNYFYSFFIFLINIL